MTRDDECFFICLIAIYMSSSQKCLSPVPIFDLIIDILLFNFVSVLYNMDMCFVW